MHLNDYVKALKVRYKRHYKFLSIMLIVLSNILTFRLMLAFKTVLYISSLFF